MSNVSFQISPKRIKGFTLTELLVVVFVIVVLGALITSGFQALKTRNQTSQCAANLRQLYVMTQLYATEHDGFLPRAMDAPKADGTRPSWFNTLEAAGIFAVYNGRIEGMDGWSGKDTQHIARCPAREDKAAHKNTKDKNGYFHYGMNNCPGGLDTVSGPVKLVAIEQPSRTFLIADADAQFWLGRIKGGALRVSHAAYPHRGGSNLVFADGHAEWHAEPLPEITSTVESPSFPWWGN